MNRTISDAMFARVGSYANAIKNLLKLLRRAWGSPDSYRPGDHYMRGPGPKWHAKHAQDRTAPELAQRPMVIGDKWDF